MNHLSPSFPCPRLLPSPLPSQLVLLLSALPSLSLKASELALLVLLPLLLPLQKASEKGPAKEGREEICEMLRSGGEEQMIHAANMSAKASSNALEAGLRVTVRKGWRWQWQGILWPRAGG